MKSILLVYPALVTWAAMALYFYTMFAVGKARKAHQVPPPATTGPDAFTRIFRVQQNTLEQLVFFLPSLWLFALYFNPLWAGILGAVWVAARIYYAISYNRDADKRLPGFLVGVLVTWMMLAGALYGMVNMLFVIGRISSGNP